MTKDDNGSSDLLLLVSAIALTLRIAAAGALSIFVLLGATATVAGEVDVLRSAARVVFGEHGAWTIWSRSLQFV
jgi:hypothetical protein